MTYARNQASPFWATALSGMTAAGQRFARGVDALIRRSPALSPHLWVGSGYRTSSSEHILGRALDIIAWEVGQRARTAKPAAYAATQRLVHEVLVPNAQALHIRHIIWDRRIYRTRYGAWGALPGRTASSGVSDWHEDHAHVLLEPSTPGWLPSLDRVTLGGKPAPTPPKPAPAAKPGKIVVTGTMDAATVQALQTRLRDRYQASGTNGRPLTVDKIAGVQTYGALQRVIQYRMPRDWSTWPIDGKMSPAWVKRLQWLVSVRPLDGVWGAQTTRGLQTALNEGRI